MMEQDESLQESSGQLGNQAASNLASSGPYTPAAGVWEEERQQRVEADSTFSDGITDHQPIGSPPMSYRGPGMHNGTVTTFLMREPGPNLQKLTKVYYRLSTKYGPLQSRRALHADDPSLSFFYEQHVPPPKLCENFLAHIASKENIHPSRMSLFVNKEVKKVVKHWPVGRNDVVHLEHAVVTPGYEARHAASELFVHVELSRTADREEADDPLPVCTRAARTLCDRSTHVECLTLCGFILCGVGQGLVYRRNPENMICSGPSVWKAPVL